MKHHERAFFQLYGDSIWHTHQAIKLGSDTPSIAAEKATRAAIISSAIALECASNCALFTLDVSKHLHESLDKLGPLGKYELVARINRCDFDFGDSRVAAMKELITLRNEYAHPKVNKIPIEISSMKSDTVKPN